MLALHTPVKTKIKVTFVELFRDKNKADRSLETRLAFCKAVQWNKDTIRQHLVWLEVEFIVMITSKKGEERARKATLLLILGTDYQLI